MKIELRLPHRIDLQAALREYDEELDDVRSILSDVCHALEGQAELVISGFGQERWPVDVGTDLTVLLEQLPSVIRLISTGESAELDLYEQGIERVLVFAPADEWCDISCEGRRRWQPNPSVERMKRADIAEMLAAVRDGFMRLLRSSAPELAEHPWVVSWLRG